MLQVKNATEFPATIFAMPDPDGIESVYAILKATFRMGKEVRPAEEQVPIAPRDTYRGAPDRSSIETAGDVSGIKPGTDVLLAGHAYAPNGKRTTRAEVALTVGALRKAVTVFGDRVWESGVFGAHMSSPKPFDSMPLVWERAFGGGDAAATERRQEAVDERNPVGRGFRSPARKEIDGLPLPNLEDPAALVESPKDRPAPVAFAPVCPHWQPRRGWAGTYDEAWQATRSPFLPTDFDPRFFQVAPPPLVVPGYLKGGEPVELRGATPDAPLRFELPRRRVTMTYRLDAAEHVREANLDTVLFDADAARLVMVWRSTLQCDKRTLRVREVEFAMTAGA
jgi:hypothetical protein